MHYLPTRAATLALAATLLTATAALAGPPWISIEYPSNPFDAVTKNALFTVHTYHHGMPMQFPVRAYAETENNGRRERIALQVVATSHTGVWAVRGELPRTGSYVIRADMTDNETNSMATALIAVSAGEIVNVKVPWREKSGWVVPQAATQRDVDLMLATARAFDGARPRQNTLLENAPAARKLAGAGVLVLLPVLLFRRRRRQRTGGI